MYGIFEFYRNKLRGKRGRGIIQSQMHYAFIYYYLTSLYMIHAICQYVPHFLLRICHVYGREIGICKSEKFILQINTEKDILACSPTSRKGQ